MTSKVYFTDLRSRNKHENKINRIKRLFDACGFNKLVDRQGLTAIKLHFGEEGNDSFIKPIFVRSVVEKILENLGNPFISL